MFDAARFPPFQPHPLLRGPHRQTIAGVYLPSRRRPYQAQRHQVLLDDGDRLVLHDDCPASWQPGGRVALLIHGLAGCHQSAYMPRVAGKLNERGIRTFRLDLRGCGAGLSLARLPYHSGRSADAAAALRFLEKLCPGSPATLIGFSLGGNITLKLLGEVGRQGCAALDSAIAVCPPLDLAAAAVNLPRVAKGIYDRHFVSLLLGQLRMRGRQVPDAVPLRRGPRPRTLYELDDCYTAPVGGFGTAQNYYRECSSGQFVPKIRLPTLILASRDDPLIPASQYRSLSVPSDVELHLTDHGGHMGFIAAGGSDTDRRWCDWRIVDWVLSR